MTFYDGKELDEKIIGNYTFFGDDAIRVNYLFTDEVINYYCVKARNIEAEISEIMMKQALDRDKELYSSIYKETIKNIIEALSTVIPYTMSRVIGVQFIGCLSFILGLVSLISFSNNYEKLKELKKYRLYFKIKDELEKDENSDITKIIEFDPIYRKPINIGSLDEFTYSDVKKLKKELVKRNSVKLDKNGVKQV